MSLSLDNSRRDDAQWESHVREQVRLVWRTMQTLRSWSAESKDPEKAFAMLSRPYERLLDELYERDLPLAKVLDRSDIVIRVEGAGVDDGPRLALLSRLFTRTQKALAGLMGLVDADVAKLELALAGLAPGSLVLGLTVVASEQKEALLISDPPTPARQAVRPALDVLRSAVRMIDVEGASVKELEGQSPRARDTSYSIVHALAPSTHDKLTSLQVFGPGGLTATTLTKETRQHARTKLNAPGMRVDELESLSVVGEVRELDLDAHRLELRRMTEVEGVLRCVYGAATRDEEAEGWLNKTVMVSGKLERDKKGRASLLWIENIHLVPSSP